MEEKTKFFYRALADNEIFSELCAEFGISRRTGCKWGRRYEEDGVRELQGRSSKPANSRSSLDEDVVIHAATLKRYLLSRDPNKVCETPKKYNLMKKKDKNDCLYYTYSEPD